MEIKFTGEVTDVVPMVQVFEMSIADVEISSEFLMRTVGEQKGAEAIFITRRKKLTRQTGACRLSVRAKSVSEGDLIRA